MIKTTTGEKKNYHPLVAVMSAAMTKDLKTRVGEMKRAKIAKKKASNDRKKWVMTTYKLFQKEQRLKQKEQRLKQKEQRLKQKEMASYNKVMKEVTKKTKAEAAKAERLQAKAERDAERNTKEYKLKVMITKFALHILNTSSQKELLQYRGIGPATAFHLYGTRQGLPSKSFANMKETGLSDKQVKVFIEGIVAEKLLF